MSVWEPKAGRRFPSVWRAVVCAALAVLFLYNPFLAAQDQHSNLTVCQPARHRATIGASELERFPEPSSMAVSLPDVEVARMFLAIPAPDVEPTPDQAVRDEGAPPRTGFSQSLWFRPPPAV